MKKEEGKMKNRNNKNKGITLIALIITIIVLLILAGVAINLTINQGDLFGKANEAKTRWNEKVLAKAKQYKAEKNRIKEFHRVLLQVARVPRCQCE